MQPTLSYPKQFSEVQSPILRENYSHLNVFTSPNSSKPPISFDKENQQITHPNPSNQIKQKLEQPIKPSETPLMDSEITEIKKKLQIIFSFYASFGDRRNLKSLKSTKFLKMMADSGLKDSQILTQKRLDLLFMAESQHRSHIAFHSFLKILIKVALYRYPDASETQALKRVLYEHFEPLYNNILQETDLGIEKKRLSQDIDVKIIEMLHMLMPIFSRIYLAYFPWEPKSYQPLAETSKRSEASLFIFLKDFEICPAILTKSKAYLLYNEVLDMEKQGIYYYFQMEDIGTCFSFFRFLLFLARTALLTNPDIDQEIAVKNILERMELSSGFMNLEKRLNIPFSSKLSLRVSMESMIEPTSKENLEKTTYFKENSVVDSSIDMMSKFNDILLEYEEPFKKIFHYYCGLGEPLNTKSLKSIKFMRFLKEMDLFTNKIDQNFVDLLLVKLKGKTGKLEFNGFIRALELLAHKLRPDIDEKTAFLWLIEKYIIEFSEKLNQFKNQLDEKSDNFVQLLMDLLQDSEILDLLGTVHKSLKFYYDAYCNTQGLMSFDAFAHFSKDFEIFPTIMTKPRLLKIFETLASVFQRTEAEKFNKIDTTGYIDQHLFIEGLALCAFEVNYQAPEPNNFEKVYYFLEKINQSEGLGVIQRKKGSGLKAQNWDLLQEYRRKTMGNNNSSVMNRSRSSGISGISIKQDKYKSMGLDFEALLRK